MLTEVDTAVLVLVLVDVLVDGASVVVVVVVVVVGTSVVVAGASALVDGDSVTVCVVPPGPGATGAADVVAPDEVDDVVDVPAGLLPLLPVNFTTA